ncbi:hypothetical protein PFISCL1PPCAC_7706, partial [Pristionchus fissidentatus]
STTLSEGGRSPVFFMVIVDFLLVTGVFVSSSLFFSFPISFIIFVGAGIDFCCCGGVESASGAALIVVELLLLLPAGCAVFAAG